jgi:hypothetical protein
MEVTALSDSFRRFDSTQGGNGPKKSVPKLSLGLKKKSSTGQRSPVAS